MLAIDTNIVVRYLTGDDPEQANQVRTLFEQSEVFVATTVLLETEWVLRSAYRTPRAAALAAIAAFCGLPQVRLEDGELAATALKWAEQGLDFADALHLAGSAACSAFITFDQRLTRRATDITDIKVREP